MKVNSAEQVPSQAVQMEGANGCSVRWLLESMRGSLVSSVLAVPAPPGLRGDEHAVVVTQASAPAVAIPRPSRARACRRTT